jgi:hypothetical protein
LRGPIKLGSAGQLAQDFLSHRFLRRRVAGIGFPGNHDHAQFHLFLDGELIDVLPVVLVHLGRRNDRVHLRVLAAHGRHDDSLQFHLFEFT